jgi:hypothetical protein
MNCPTFLEAMHWKDSKRNLSGRGSEQVMKKSAKGLPYTIQVPEGDGDRAIVYGRKLPYTL